MSPLYEKLQRHFGADHEETRRCAVSLARSYNDAAEGERSIALLQPIYQTSASDKPHHWEMGNTLAISYVLAGDLPQAVTHAEAHHAAAVEHLAADDVNLTKVVDALGLCYTQSGRAGEAIELHEAALQQSLDTRGEDHPATLRAKTNLADAFLMLNAPDRAIKLLRDVFAIQEKTLGAEHWASIQTAMSLGEALRATRVKEKLLEALSLNERTLQIARDAPFDLTRTVAALSNNLAICYNNVGRHAESARLAEEAIRLIRTTYPESHPDVLAISRNLARDFRNGNQLKKSRALVDSMLRATRANYPTIHHTYVSTELIHVRLLVDEGRPQAAIDRAVELREALEAFQPQSPYVESLRKYDLNDVERAYRAALLANGDYALAETESRAHLPEYRQQYIPQRKLAAVSSLERQLAEALLGQGKLDAAQEMATLAVERLSHYSRLQDKPVAWTLLGRIETARRNFVAAEDALLQAYYEMIAAEDYDAPYYTTDYQAAETALVERYEAWQKPQEAHRWRTAGQ